MKGGQFMLGQHSWPASQNVASAGCITRRLSHVHAQLEPRFMQVAKGFL